MAYFQLDLCPYRYGNRPSSELALCLLCAWLSWPHRLWELSRLFGRSQGWISAVLVDTLLFLDERYRRIIEWYPGLDYSCIRRYARALRSFGGSNIIWGFIDGTWMGVARPTKEQRDYYSGYRHRHGIKFQGIMAPDGLICSLCGPYIGEINDNSMVTESGIGNRLDTV